MSDIPAFPYDILWGERSLGSVANLTRRDGEEFLALAPQVPVRTEVEVFPLEEADEPSSGSAPAPCAAPRCSTSPLEPPDPVGHEHRPPGLR